MRGNDIKKIIGSDLRHIRKFCMPTSLTQEEVSNLCGWQCSSAFVGRIERGEVNPTVETLSRIALSLGRQLKISFVKIKD